MSKLEQVLQLLPPIELRFRGPFIDVVTSELKLYNPSKQRVCFKVKTTAPKKYCVRPNSGIIEPGQTVNVAVMLQPFDYDPGEKNKHKFMVQSMFAPDGQIESQEALWKDATPDKLMDSKLKCCFEMPIEDPTLVNNLDTSNTVQAEKASLPQKNVVNSPEADTPIKVNNLETELKQAHDDGLRLKQEMDSMKEENSRLRDDGVRLRKMAMSDTVSSTPPKPSMPPDNLSTLNQLPPVAYIILAVLLGLIIGKFIL